MTNTSNETATPPVAKLRIGLVSASIWQNTGDNGPFHSVTFERRYKDSEGEWQSTSSYKANDLLQLAKLADQAHTKILEIQSGDAE